MNMQKNKPLAYIYKAGMYALIFSLLYFSHSFKVYGETMNKNTGSSTLNIKISSGIQYVESSPLFGSLHAHKFLMDNGLKILLVQDKSAEVFAYQTWINAGGRDDWGGVTGLAHLFEHMMFKATKNFKEGKFDKLLEEAGSTGTNASTFFDWTYYRENLPKDKLELVMKLESDRMVNLLVNKDSLAKERDVVVGEKRLRYDNNPQGAWYEYLYDLAFTLHPYKTLTIGKTAHIQNVQVEDCLSFYRAYYAPNNATVVIVGDIDFEQTLLLLKKYYGHLKSQPVKTRIYTQEPEQKGEARRIVYREDIETEMFILGFHVPEITSADNQTMDVLNTILFGGKSSRLYKKLVDAEIASSAEGWVPSLNNPALYEIEVVMKEGGKAEEAEKIITDEFISVAKNGVTDKELEKVKNQIDAGFYSGLETMEGKAFLLGNTEIEAGDYKFLKTLIERYQKVTSEDVKQCAIKYLNNNNKSLVHLIPKKTAQ